MNNSTKIWPIFDRIGVSCLCTQCHQTPLELVLHGFVFELSPKSLKIKKANTAFQNCLNKDKVEQLMTGKQCPHLSALLHLRKALLQGYFSASLQLTF